MPHGPILIVDDDPSQLELIRDVLEQHGHEVQTAADGKSALAMVSTRRPALILLDLIMPVMTGYEFLRHLWAMEDLQDIPVVVVSGAHVPNPGGTVAFLKKPINISDLISLCAPYLPFTASARVA